ncbi:MAG: NAD(P)-dependent oxidoreductase [Clostridiales bacterium]|nr:NAD(P)-dependent oxidoreductase [Clostridiales bacterium]
MTEFDRIINSNTDISALKNSTVMITGATGTVGSYLLDLLLYYNKIHGANINIVCPVRNLAKIPDELKSVDKLDWIEFDLTKELNIARNVDYVVHCAGPTRSAEMVERPVDTVNAIALGTENMLEFFRKHGGKGFLYLSSVEIYGENFDETKVLTEDTMGAVNTLAVRSSYPEAKRLAETLCVAYSAQYGLPVKIARLSQILGVGKGDNRLIAYLCDCARNKQQIVLKSDGKATKAYCYIADCISALITILVKGENTAYNIANENMVLSVRELADFVSSKYIGKSVIIENKATTIYPKSSYLVMDSAKLQGLGWNAVFGLDEAFDGLIG